MRLDIPEDEFVSLRLEVDHLKSQLVVAHTMAMDWRQRCKAAEQQCAHLHKQLETVRRKLQAKAGQKTPRATDPGDAILDWLQAQEDDDEREVDSPHLE
jgi:hypothetical protein